MPDPITSLNAALEGRYRIERELGEGGMAIVYLAEDLKHDRSVAVKVLKPGLAAVIGVERFLAEIKTTANLQHPRILPLFDSGEADGILYYVMPYVEGETLRDRLDREGSIGIEDALSIIHEAAQALDHAHARGVIHRDVKPENVFMVERADGSRFPKLLDLGLAKLVSTDDEAQPYKLTMRGAVFGTPAYMAPEQGSGEEVDARADLYSVTVMLFEMLTGQRPFKARDSPALLVMHKLRPAPTLDSRAPFLSVYPQLQELVSRGLAKAPEDRFADAEEYRAALESVLVEVDQIPLARSDAFLGPSSSPEAPTVPASAGSDAGAGARRRPSTILFVVALLVLVVALALLWAA